MALRVFPVEWSAHPTFQDTWGASRGDGRVHEGVDIFAPLGSHVHAVDAGTLTFGTNKLGGTFAILTSSDGERYYFAHLSATEGAPRRVDSGEIIGYVGNTGNAAGGPTHVHFQQWNSAGELVDPFAMLTAIAPPGAAPAAPSFDGVRSALATLGVLLAGAVVALVVASRGRR